MDDTKARGTGPWYLAAAVATGVSTDTSWRFFGDNLHVTDLRERVALFAVLEIALFAAAWSMRAGVRRTGNPGSSRFVAWALCGASAYMALEVAGPVLGGARVLLGPVLAVVALHQALGIEIKVRHGVRSGTWARIGRELRERMLSCLGLGDDTRDAKRRSKERAAVKAATLATARKVNTAKLRKAVLASEAATDADTRALILGTVAALKSLDKLATLERTSPWVDKVVDVDMPVPRVPRPRRPSSAPTSGGPVPGWDVDKAVRLILDGAPADEVMALTGASAKDVQRTRRVIRGIQERLSDEVLATGGVTLARVQRVRKAMA